MGEESIRSTVKKMMCWMATNIRVERSVECEDAHTHREREIDAFLVWAFQRSGLSVNSAGVLFDFHQSM